MRHIDIVFCIENTSATRPYAENYRKNVKNILTCFRESFDGVYGWSDMEACRVRFITFGDFACSSKAITETDFIDVTTEEGMTSALEYVDGIKFSGGYGYCNALEAIAEAMKSEWYTGDIKSKYHIVLLSNGRVRPLGGNQRLVSTYPEVMPKDLEELSRWWADPAGSGIMHTYAERYTFLHVIAPAGEPWEAILPWPRYRYFQTECFSGPDYLIDAVDVSAIADCLVDPD